MLKKLQKLIRARNIEIESTFEEVFSLKFYMRRIYLEDKILNSTDSGISDIVYGPNEIIVSLTTYGRRIKDVCFSIESLMQQTLKANKIVLWLDEELDGKTLPSALNRQIDRGLTIKYTKDIRSYKKLIPALMEYPESAIITVDDDIIYDFDFLESIIRSYQTAPSAIHACRIHSMTFDNMGNLNPYVQWDLCKATIPKRYFFTTGGGTLFTPHSLHADTINDSIFTSLAPTADDVWFNAMAKLNGTDIIKVKTRSSIGEDYLYNDAVQDMGLANINFNGKNDEQIKAIFSKYDIYNLIK